MVIKFQAPASWWSRGVQLLWLFPQGEIIAEGDRWDLAVLVEEKGEELFLSVNDGEKTEQRVVAARPLDFMHALFCMLSEKNRGPLSLWGILTGVRPGKVAAGLIDT